MYGNYNNSAVTQNAETKLERHIWVFLATILELIAMGEGNVVLGGSLVLELHGLKLGWEPQDLDIIIFKPTERQFARVMESTDFEACANSDVQSKAEQRGEHIRSWRSQSGGKTLNVILVNDPLPEDLLLYRSHAGLIPVNKIHNIIEAKKSYSHGHDKTFIRGKDVHHLMSLKNNNFNI